MNEKTGIYGNAGPEGGDVHDRYLRLRKWAVGAVFGSREAEGFTGIRPIRAWCMITMVTTFELYLVSMLILSLASMFFYGAVTYFCMMLLTALCLFSYRFTKNYRLFSALISFAYFFHAFFMFFAHSGFYGASGVLMWGMLGVVVAIFYCRIYTALAVFAGYSLCIYALVVLERIGVRFLGYFPEPSSFGMLVTNIFFLTLVFGMSLWLFFDEVHEFIVKSDNYVKTIKTERARLSEMNDEYLAMNETLKQSMEETRRAQAGLIRAEKMTALGRLVAGIAHEINTPLGVIKASAGYMDDTLKRVDGDFIERVNMLDERRLAFLKRIIAMTSAGHNDNTTSAQRRLKQALMKRLAEEDVDNPFHIAGILVELNITAEDLTDDIIEMLRTEEEPMLLSTALGAANLIKCVDNIQIATDRASKVVYALKSYSHFNVSNRPVMADVRKGIEIALTLYQNQLKAGIQVVRDFDDIPEINCFEDDLNHIWSNIIDNAIDAMTAQGKLVITVRNLGEKIRVSIADTGSGIPDEIKNDIFEPFYTTKPIGEGSGIGLEISKRIVDRHNGRIWIEDNPGGGAVFFVELPKDIDA